MNRHRRTLVTGAALTLAAALFVVGDSGRGGPAGAESVGRFDHAEARTQGRTIGELQQHLKRNGDDATAWGRLGFAYLEAARTESDPALYPRAEGAFKASLDRNPADNFAALAGMGALANARHDFAGGLEWGRRAESLNRNSPEVRAVIGDALVELGRYEEAFAAYQAMVDLAPGQASFTRASYALDLQGDVDGARRVLHLALGDVIAPAQRAFGQYSLGELAWSTGDLVEAQRRYQAALVAEPGLVSAQAGLARVVAARGDTTDALRRWHDVVTRSPLPEYVGELANLYLAVDRPAEARAQQELLAVQRKLAEANGVNGDLELALSSADHHLDLPAGLAAAEEEWSRRRSIHVADALGWQLHAHGRSAEALPYADQALRLGTRNALFHFHRGMIRAATGDTAGATADLETALALNPHFSPLHAPTATATLAGLGPR